MIMMPFGNPLPEGVKSKMIPVAKDGVCLCSCCTGTFDCRTAKSPNRDDGKRRCHDNGPIIDCCFVLRDYLLIQQQQPAKRYSRDYVKLHVLIFEILFYSLTHGSGFYLAVWIIFFNELFFSS